MCTNDENANLWQWKWIGFRVNQLVSLHLRSPFLKPLREAQYEKASKRSLFLQSSHKGHDQASLRGRRQLSAKNRQTPKHTPAQEQECLAA